MATGLQSPSEVLVQPGLGKFNGYMTLRSYIGGYTPSAADIDYYTAFNAAHTDLKTAPHVSRWFNHIKSFSDAERSSWPLIASSTFTSTSASSAATNQSPVKEDKAPDGDDPFGDEDDLFGDGDGEEDAAAAQALQERLQKEAKERAAQKMKNARSLIVLEVKPYEAEFDLESLAQGIKAMTHEGIQNWGQEHKLAPIAYGIKKLVISVVVYDDLIGVDDICDMINEKYEEDVQSIDVQAMSKV